MRKKEGEYIRALKTSLNKNIAGWTKQEYDDEHKEVIAKRKKEHREHNKQCSQKRKEYHNTNKEEIKHRHKEFRNNKEYEKQRHKKYYEEVSKQSFECECSCVVKRLFIKT